MRCKDCKSDNVESRTGKPSRTPGFFPDWECLDCGFRWIDVIQKGRGTRLRELHEAAKEMRNKE